MPISFPCDCGTRLKVPDALAGRKLKCPRCARVVDVPATSEPPPQPEPDLAAALPEEPEPLPAARIRGRRPPPVLPTPRPRRGPRLAFGHLRTRVPVAWEVYVVVALYALGVLGHVLTKNVLGAVVGVIIGLGLLARSGCVWWFIVVTSGLLGLFSLWCASVLEKPDHVRLFVLLGLDYLVAPILLVVCKLRGAYDA